MSTKSASKTACKGSSRETVHDASTKPLFERLKLPANCKDVTSEQSGNISVIIGASNV